MRRIIGVCLLALVTLLGACSAVKLGYNQLPDVTLWWLDGYIDTTSAQSPRVRRDLDDLLLWHRSAELPRYADLLQKLQRLTAGPVTPTQVCGLVDDVRLRLDVLRQRSEPQLLAFAQTLSPAQLDHLTAKFAKSNTEWRAEWLDASDADILARRLKQAVQRGERLYDRLDEPQVQLLRAGLQALPLNSALMWAERQRRQQDVLTTLQQLGSGKLSGEPAKAALAGVFARLVTSPDPAYRAWSEAMLQGNCALAARLQNQTSTAQRERAAGNLRGYEDDLRSLSAAR